VAPTSGPFCPNCGAQNPISAAHCGACGETLPRREDLASLWGSAPTAKTVVTTRDPSLQNTQVIPQSYSAEQTWTVKPTPPQPSTASWEIKAPERVERGSWAPSGVLLGAVALVLIFGVIAALGWFAGLPILRDQLQTQVTEAVSHQVASLATLPMKSSGEIVVSEKKINQSLRAHEKSYEPLKNPTVNIDTGQITVSVDAYGTTTTYTADAKIEKGKLVVVNPKVDGPAGQILSADELANIIEEQFSALMNRFDRTPTAIRFRDGSISVATKPTAA
jgi:hypothetical protein